jgi:hypothetical protein
MKGNPAGPGGSLTSKPTWSNTSGCSATSAFYFACGGAGRSQAPGRHRMEKSNLTKAQQIADAASAFELRRTGHIPKWATVVLGEETLVARWRGPYHR